MQLSFALWCMTARRAWAVYPVGRSSALPYRVHSSFVSCAGNWALRRFHDSLCHNPVRFEPFMSRDKVRLLIEGICFWSCCHAGGAVEQRACERASP